MAAKKLDPLDLYDIRAELTEEEAMVKDTVGRMVDEKVITVFDNLMRNAVTYSPAGAVIQCTVTEAETFCPVSCMPTTTEPVMVIRSPAPI